MLYGPTVDSGSDTAGDLVSDGGDHTLGPVDRHLAAHLDRSLVQLLVGAQRLAVDLSDQLLQELDVVLGLADLVLRLGDRMVHRALLLVLVGLRERDLLIATSARLHMTADVLSADVLLRPSRAGHQLARAQIGKVRFVAGDVLLQGDDRLDAVRLVQLQRELVAARAGTHEETESGDLVTVLGDLLRVVVDRLDATASLAVTLVRVRAFHLILLR